MRTIRVLLLTGGAYFGKDFSIPFIKDSWQWFRENINRGHTKLHSYIRDGLEGRDEQTRNYDDNHTLDDENDEASFYHQMLSNNETTVTSFAPVIQEKEQTDFSSFIVREKSDAAADSSPTSLIIPVMLPPEEKTDADDIDEKAPLVAFIDPDEPPESVPQGPLLFQRYIFPPEAVHVPLTEIRSEAPVQSPIVRFIFEKIPEILDEMDITLESFLLMLLGNLIYMKVYQWIRCDECGTLSLHRRCCPLKKSKDQNVNNDPKVPTDSNKLRIEPVPIPVEVQHFEISTPTSTERPVMPGMSEENGSAAVSVESQSNLIRSLPTPHKRIFKSRLIEPTVVPRRAIDESESSEHLLTVTPVDGVLEEPSVVEDNLVKVTQVLESLQPKASTPVKGNNDDADRFEKLFNHLESLENLQADEKPPANDCMKHAEDLLQNVVESIETHDYLNKKVATRLESFHKLRDTLSQCQEKHSSTIMKSIPLTKLVAKLHCKLDSEESRGKKLLGLEADADEDKTPERSTKLEVERSGSSARSPEADRHRSISVPTPAAVWRKEAKAEHASIKSKAPSAHSRPVSLSHSQKRDTTTESDRSFENPTRSFLRQPRSFEISENYAPSKEVDTGAGSISSSSRSAFNRDRTMDDVRLIDSKLTSPSSSDTRPVVMSVARPMSRQSALKQDGGQTNSVSAGVKVSRLRTDNLPGDRIETGENLAKSMLRQPRGGIRKSRWNNVAVGRRTISSPPPLTFEKDCPSPPSMIKSGFTENIIRRTTSSPPPVSDYIPNTPKEKHTSHKDARGRTSEMRHIHEKTSLLRRKQKARQRIPPVKSQQKESDSLLTRQEKLLPDFEELEAEVERSLSEQPGNNRLESITMDDLMGEVIKRSLLKNVKCTSDVTTERETKRALEIPLSQDSRDVSSDARSASIDPSQVPVFPMTPSIKSNTLRQPRNDWKKLKSKEGEDNIGDGSLSPAASNTVVDIRSEFTSPPLPSGRSTQLSSTGGTARLGTPRSRLETPRTSEPTHEETGGLPETGDTVTQKFSKLSPTTAKLLAAVALPSPRTPQSIASGASPKFNAAVIERLPSARSDGKHSSRSSRSDGKRSARSEDGGTFGRSSRFSNTSINDVKPISSHHLSVAPKLESFVKEKIRHIENGTPSHSSAPQGYPLLGDSGKGHTLSHIQPRTPSQRSLRDQRLQKIRHTTQSPSSIPLPTPRSTLHHRSDRSRSNDTSYPNTVPYPDDLTSEYSAISLSSSSVPASRLRVPAKLLLP